MSQATLKLHEQLIRLVKGAVKAWEEWLNDRKLEQHQTQKT